MAPDPVSRTTPRDDRPRLRMRPAGAQPSAVHGAWWPRSWDLCDQLQSVLPGLWDRLDGIEQVVYNTATWPPAPPRMDVRGRAVRLVASPTHPVDRISLVAASTRRVTTLLVVPVSTDAQDAELTLAAVGAPAGEVMSRFVGAGHGAPGHHGARARAREAEEEHSADARTGAVRTVAGHAVDADDCTLLLAMLGLDARDGGRPDALDY